MKILILKKIKAALLVIDLENGFVRSESSHVINTAAASLPACEQVIQLSRKKGLPVFFIKRIYRQNGSDVELTRWQAWINGGKAMTPASKGAISAEVPETVKPKPGDYTIIKPRWSAFFQTELDLILRRLGISTVVLIGTTTPNCIRTTAYDAIALDYEVVIVEDCCSSQTPEIQKANIDDLQRIGCMIIDSENYCHNLPQLPCQDWLKKIRADMNKNNNLPEPFEDLGEGGTGWIDRW
ncbi:cysteine hydrolase family protein [Desulfofarcimen acetoxidans]|uniref:cysteine hydrolase family protein n=1 Tax=Desulfofarcimen acetoxidans TaxID=58138 RepID=UPI003BEF3903